MLVRTLDKIRIKTTDYKYQNNMTMKKNLLLIVAMLLVGVASVLADDVTYSPTQDVYFRTSLSGETYSWNNGYPKTASSDNNTFAGNLRVGMFVLQKYEVANLNNATSIKIVLTGNSGTDALAFWLSTPLRATILQHSSSSRMEIT